jgi:hypothetical protein
MRKEEKKKTTTGSSAASFASIPPFLGFHSF